MTDILKKVRSFGTRIQIKLHERKFRGQLPFLFFDNHSDSLMIVFSAFTGPKRRYNYVKGLRELKMNKLYILDPFGYLGSYNLLEGGSDHPERLTRGLIELYLSKKEYSHVYTVGSSKGGTCAIYYGLEYNAEIVFSGACQYNLGSYLHRPDHEKIFQTMKGEGDIDFWCRKLNSIMPALLEKHRQSETCLHIVYSKNELTYQRQIVDLLAKLKDCQISYVEIEEAFKNHEDVGTPFLSYVLRHFSEASKKNAIRKNETIG